MESLMKLPFIYLHRWLRIATPYVFIMIFWVSIYNKFSETLIHHPPDACLNEGFIYNMFLVTRDASPGVTDTYLCNPMLWYLLVDMRVFLFIPVVALIYHHVNKIFCFVGCVIAVIMNILFRLFFLRDHHVSSFMGIEPSDFAFYNDHVYRTTWARYGAMVVGMAMGLAWNIWFKHRGKFSVVQASIIGFLSLGLIGTVWFTSFNAYQDTVPCYTLQHLEDCGSGWSAWSKAWWGALGRNLWALGLSLLFLLCAKNQFPFVNAFLSHRFLDPFAKLSYTMYLTQYWLMHIYFDNIHAPMRFSYTWLITTFMGLSLGNALWALYFHSVIEVPFAYMTTYMVGLLTGQAAKKEYKVTRDQATKRMISGPEYDTINSRTKF